MLALLTIRKYFRCFLQYTLIYLRGPVPRAIVVANSFTALRSSASFHSSDSLKTCSWHAGTITTQNISCVIELSVLVLMLYDVRNFRVRQPLEFTLHTHDTRIFRAQNYEICFLLVRRRHVCLRHTANHTKLNFVLPFMLCIFPNHLSSGFS
jgi:hypothetical protein